MACKNYTLRSVYVHDKLPSEKAAAMARWLVAQNKWGVLSTISIHLGSTISIHLGGSPFGNVVSFSDGVPGSGRGIPYFYLTARDPSPTDAAKDPRTSLTVSEYALGNCGQIDPENPTCDKLSLSGKLKLVDAKSEEATFAKDALFSKHPEMMDWPVDHGFQIYKLDIENLFLIDWFGPAKEVPVAEYLGACK